MADLLFPALAANSTMTCKKGFGPSGDNCGWWVAVSRALDKPRGNSVFIIQ